MSKRPADLSLKAEELRRIIIKYNGIPSQTVDRKAYALIKSYLQRHGDAPEIKALVEEFKLTTPKRLNKDEKLEKIKKIIEENERIPSSLVDDKSYRLINAYFKEHSQDPEVIKLMYITAHNSVFSLQDDERPERWRNVWGDTNSEYYQWREDKALEYAMYVFDRYGVLPAKKTKPMEVINHSIERYIKYQNTLIQNEKVSLINFLDHIFRNGYNEKYIELYRVYRCQEFDTPAVQKRINDMMIYYGACTVQFIANHAIDSISLPIGFVHYYYMVRQRKTMWNIRPVGKVYGFYDKGDTVLMVHYRDYYKCDIDRIRKNAIAHSRDWYEEPPVTDEEHIAYAQWRFFVMKDDYINHKRVFMPNWNITIIQNCIDNCTPRDYYNDWSYFQYIDFYIFLLENNLCDISKVSYYLISFVQNDHTDSPETDERKKYVERLLQFKHIQY